MEPELLTYDLGEGVRAFSTKRKGGYSEGPYASFNANAYCGDDSCKVRLNRELLCRCLGLEFPRLIMPHQVHGACVRRIGEGFFGLTDEAKAAALEGVDAVMTDLPRTCVSVSTADCIPILMYDAAHHAVAAVHAGWRSTLLRIPLAALRAMAEAYGTKPPEVRAVVGPGISLEAFEVGDEVYEAFHEAGFPMERLARRLSPLQNRLLRLKGEVSQSDGGVSRPQEHSVFSRPQDVFSAYAPVGVKPLRPVGPAPLSGGAVASCRFCNAQSSEGEAEKWHIDLWQANVGLLEQAGVPPENIQVAGICTYRNPECFFSARRLGVRSGRILNGIFLKS